MRKFATARAVRANVPLLIALIGPSTSGKTYSAHRIAKGIQRVQPGPIYGIDTENRGTRMLELAADGKGRGFEFTHMPFEAPFGSLDYLAAITQAASEGARTVIVDSMSHEHEGEGGCLDYASQEVEKAIARKVRFGDLKSAEGDEADKVRQKQNKSSWIKPKAARGKLIQGMQQLNINLILCFRAKEKIDPKPQKDDRGNVKDFATLGWQPIGGDEFWYEMTTRCLLLPGANGVPSWTGLEKGEALAARRPEWALEILKNGRQLTEDVGEELGRWANGTSAEMVAALELVRSAATTETLRAQAEALSEATWTETERATIKRAIGARSAALKGGK
jgi:hypothetical protein